MKERIIHTQYCDSNSILVITLVGRIKQLWVPFKVICIEAVGDFPFESIVYVEEVFCNEKDQLVYFIWGKYFFHYYFRIILFT